MNAYNAWLVFILACLVLSDKLTTGSQLSQDGAFYREFLMPGVSPKTKDAYVCTAMRLNATEEWIIRYEPLASANRAHHMLLYGCRGVNNINKKGYWDCGHHGICSGSRIIYAWAKNAPSTQLPDEVGFRIGRDWDVNYLVLQIHYVNPMPPGIQDHSGLKMLTTNTRQKYKAGIYLLAKGFLRIPPYTEKFHGDINCIANLSDDIKLFAYRVHAHILGVVISGYKYDQNTKKFNQIAKGNPQWPQSFYPTDEIFTIKPNDVLHARCTYNSSQRGRTTLIGATSDDEMCNLYLMFYTNREKGPDSGYCGIEQFPPLSKALPPGNDVPLPKNEKLKNQTMGESTNKDKEISYENLFDKSQSIPRGNEVLINMANKRVPIKPIPVKVNTGYEHSHSNGGIKKVDFHEALNKKKTILETKPFHLQNSWGPDHYRLGQVCGVSVDSRGDVVIFHRGDRFWDSTSFDGPHLRNKSKPISSPTLLHLEKDSGALIHKWGDQFFYMPHGLTIDMKDNIWVTDVAMHQVFKFPSDYGNGKPQVTLGKRFEPSNDRNHFCQPTSVAVLENGAFFVSDGYCNSRIIQFSIDGTFIQEIDSSKHSQIKHPFGSFNIPHSLTLAEGEKEICVADRENGRALCFDVENFAFKRQLKFPEWGQRLFAIASSKQDGKLFAVNGQQFLRGSNEVKIFQVNLATNTLETSFSPHNQGFNNPHDIAVSSDGNELYVVEIGPNKIWKFSKEVYLKTTFSSRRIINTSAVPHQHKDAGNGPTVYGDGWSSSSLSYIVLSLLTIPIIVISILAFCIYNRNRTSFIGYLGAHGNRNSGLNPLLKTQGFERVPTNDMFNDSDSMDSEIEHFCLNESKE